MANLFLTANKPLLTVMLLCETPEEAIGKIKGAICQGAEEFFGNHGKSSRFFLLF